MFAVIAMNFYFFSVCCFFGLLLGPELVCFPFKIYHRLMDHPCTAGEAKALLGDEGS